MVSIVADTNVLVSALIAHKNEWQLMRHVAENKIKLILSEPIFEELARVLNYKHLGFLAPKVEAALREYRQIATFVNPVQKLTIVTADPPDNKILEAALAGEADYVITGDSHLLNIKEFQGIRIRNAKDFLQEVKLS